ncbi:MAG: hypothetical protein Q8930_16085 [Bacillota bacterium]|nr:hypothetical protein [Bacillota bacterium]
MGFCTECGGQLGLGQYYCPMCGKRVPGDAVRVSPFITDDSAHRVCKATFTRKNPLMAGRVLTAMAFILLTVLAVFYAAGSYLTSRNHLAARIERAIKDGDAKELERHLYSSDGELKIDEESAKAVLKLINRSENFKDELIDSLRKGRDYKCFSIIETGRRLVILKKYMLKVEPQYLKITSNCEDAEVDLDGRDIGRNWRTGISESYGPFAPGIYNLDIIMNNQYGNSKITKEIELSSGETSIYGELGLKYIKLVSPINGLKLVYNGKELDTQFNKGENTIGPFPRDSEGKLVFYKDYPWGRLQSAEYDLKNMYYNIGLNNFQIRDSGNTGTMSEDLKAFLESFYSAVSTFDDRRLVNATDNCRSSFMGDYHRGINQKCVFQRCYMSSEGVTVETNTEGEDSFAVTVKTEYQIQEAADKDIFRLHISYDKEGQKWLVDDFEYLQSFDGEFTEIQ